MHFVNTQSGYEQLNAAHEEKEEFPNQIESLRYNLFHPIHQPNFTQHSTAALSTANPSKSPPQTGGPNDVPPEPNPSSRYQGDQALQHLRSIYQAKNNNIGFVLRRQKSPLQSGAPFLRTITAEG
jgi:hypothetical protein